MVNEVKERHGIENGWESHPDTTPYDSLMLKMVEEMEKVDHAKKLAKDKNLHKKEVCSAISSALCPIVKGIRRVQTIVGEDGEMLDMSEESFEELLVSNTPGSTSSSTKSEETDPFVGMLADLVDDPATKKRKLDLEEKRLEIDELNAKTAAKNADLMLNMMKAFLESKGGSFPTEP